MQNATGKIWRQENFRFKKNECKLGIFTVNAVKQPQNMQDQKSNRGENLNINSLFDLKVNYSINVFVTTFTSSNAGLF